MKINLLGRCDGPGKKIFDKLETERLMISRIKWDVLKKIRTDGLDDLFLSLVVGVNSLNSMKKWLNGLGGNERVFIFDVRKKELSSDQLKYQAGILIISFVTDERVEVGGWVCKDWQKKGIASEVLHSLPLCLRDVDKNIRCFSTVKRNNSAAQKVLDIAGFHYNCNGSSYENFIYSMSMKGRENPPGHDKSPAFYLER